MIAAGAGGYALTSHFVAVGGPHFREALVVSERPLSLDPLLAPQDAATHDVGHLLYRSLLRLDASAYPRPDLASRYVISADGLTYRVTLAGGQRWSDGRDITPADVVASIGFLQSAHDANAALAAQFEGVHSRTEGAVVVLTLPAPRASFLATLTQLQVLPLGGLTRAQLTRLGANPATVLATSGPYTVTATDAAGVSLLANPYATPQPHIPHYQLQLYATFDDAAAAFSAGEVDAVLATTPAQRARLLSVKGSQPHDMLTFRFVDLLFNERVQGLDDTVVRHALSAAVDRASIVGGALHGSSGRAQADAISDGLVWIAARQPGETTSRDAATAALEGAGWVMGPAGVRMKGGVPLAFTLSVPDVDPLPTVARELAAQLQALGVGVAVEVAPSIGFLDDTVVPHAFQLALTDWDGGPDPDVTTFWRSNATPPKGFNVSGGPPDPFLDQALDALATATDAPARIAAAQDVNRFLGDDAPAVFLYTPAVSYVTRSAISGLAIPAAGGSEARFDTVAGWQLG